MQPKIINFNDMKTKDKQKKVTKAMLSNDESTIASLYSADLIDEFRKNLKCKGRKNKNEK